MRMEIVPAREMRGELASAWHRVQENNPSLASPYFCPEYQEIVGSVRDDAFVGVCEEGGRIAAFFPFQRTLGRMGRPLGGPVSDYQALIAPRDACFDPVQLVRAAGLELWSFDHLLESQEAFRPHHERVESSPYMDLSRGFEVYEQAQRKKGSGLIPSIRRSARKLAREVGPLRYETWVTDPQVLTRVLDWKTQQSRETGTEQLFLHAWARDIIERIHATRTDAYAGVLSALWAGERLVAAHMGMRSKTVWHYWFPAYERALGKYAPGLCLLLEMARAAQAEGIRILDFGKGAQRYKSQLMSGEIKVAEGRVFARAAARRAFAVAERSAERASTFVRSSKLLGPARVPARFLRRVRTWTEYH